MKNISKIIFAVLCGTVLFSCSNDDNSGDLTGTGNMSLKFDHAYESNDLIFNQAYSTSGQEQLKVTTIKYIISNIVLTTDDGRSHAYPKSQSYFIVDESDPAKRTVNLVDIPAGNYVKIQYGIGVDQEQFNLGATGQGDFLAQAQNADMLWSWSAGYKFVAFEGTFTSPSVSEVTPFMIHTGQTGTDYNYTEVELTFPTKAMVRNEIAPAVHIVSDISVLIDGQNKIRLSDHNSMGMGAMIIGGATLPLITANLNGMFHVDHIHND